MSIINTLSKNFKNVDATDGPIFKKLLAISFPLMLTMIVSNFYEIVDNFWLGHYSANAIAASQIGRFLVWFSISLAFGIGMGGRTLLSQLKGARQFKEISSYIAQTLLFLFLISLVVSIIAFFYTEDLLILMDAPTAILHESTEYTRIILMAAPVIFIEAGIILILNGLGNTFIPFIFTLCTVCINCILDPLLIFGVGPFPEMGVTGAALATVFSRFVVSILGIAYLYRGSDGVLLRLPDFKFSLEKLKKIVQIGVPSSVGMWGTSLGFIILMRMVTKLANDFYDGDPAIITAYGISGMAIHMYFMVTAGIASGVSIMVGQNLGALNPKRAEETVWHAFIFASILLIAGSLIMYIDGGLISQIFIPSTQKSAKEIELLVGRILEITSHGVVTFGLLNIIQGAFQGAGYTVPVMWINLSRLWIIRIPLAYILSFVLMWRGDGIWWSICISNHLMAIIGLVIFLRGKWKIRVIDERPVTELQ